MYAVDFEYDGQYLSDHGFMICDFNGSSGFNTVSAGSMITFDKVSRYGGKIHSLVGTKYEDCLQATFYICKDTCKNSGLVISSDEYRILMRWLNRREFLPLHFVREGENMGDICYYDASFNVNKILLDDNLYGLELTMETNRPFGYGKEIRKSWIASDDTYTLIDPSDEIGYTYPSLSITCLESGDLTIYNDMEESLVAINNCSVGEVITIDGDALIVSTSLSSHKIYNDFNFEFLRIGNKLGDRVNHIYVSLDCEIELRYRPIIKESPD